MGTPMILLPPKNAMCPSLRMTGVEGSGQNVPMAYVEHTVIKREFDVISESRQLRRSEMFIAQDIPDFFSSVRSEMCSAIYISLLTELMSASALAAINISLLRS